MSEPVSLQAAGDYREGIRWQILKVPNLGHHCAYIGIPLDSPKAGTDYDDIPVPVHGGWTFGREGDDERFDKGWFWWGWDYAHAGDYSPGIPVSGGHFWTVDEVRAEIERVLPDFEAWLRESE